MGQEFLDLLKIPTRLTEEQRAAEISKVWKYLSGKTSKMEMKMKEMQEQEAKKKIKEQGASKSGSKKAEKRKRGKGQLEGPSTSSKQVAGGASAEYSFNEVEKPAGEQEANSGEVGKNKGAEKKKSKEKLNLSVYDFTEELEYEADEETEEGCKMT